MQKTYEFYEKNYGIYSSKVDIFLHILNRVEKGIIEEEEIRSLGRDGLIVCICERRFDLFKKLVSPFPYDENGRTYYKYLLDPFTLEIDKFIESLPNSISEQFGKMNSEAKERAELNNNEFIPVTIEEAARDAVVLYSSLKKELLDALYSIDKKKIMAIKIKDVLARQISGLGHPIRNKRDIIYYCETPSLYAALDLFEKNIITVANDTLGCYDDSDHSKLAVDLNINYDSLDNGNKQVADVFIKNGNAKFYPRNEFSRCNDVVLHVPLSKNSTVFDATKVLLELTSLFHKQDMIYGIVGIDDVINTIDNCVNWVGHDSRKKIEAILATGYSVENILKVLELLPFINYYYDREEGKFWIEKYYYDKHKKFLNDQPDFGSQGLK